MLNPRVRLAAALVAPALLLAACGGQPQSGTGNTANGTSGLSGEIRVDGSSTVGPLTAAAGELFRADEPGVNV
jgi:phosphate transport system substrate-binding protein